MLIRGRCSEAFKVEMLLLEVAVDTVQEGVLRTVSLEAGKTKHCRAQISTPHNSGLHRAVRVVLTLAEVKAKRIQTQCGLLLRKH